MEYKNSQGMYVSLTGIQTVLEDVVFYYKRKIGFPKLSDAGVVSIHVSEKPFSGEAWLTHSSFACRLVVKALTSILE